MTSDVTSLTLVLRAYLYLLQSIEPIEPTQAGRRPSTSVYLGDAKGDGKGCWASRIPRAGKEDDPGLYGLPPANPSTHWWAWRSILVRGAGRCDGWHCIHVQDGVPRHDRQDAGRLRQAVVGKHGRQGPAGDARASVAASVGARGTGSVAPGRQQQGAITPLQRCVGNGPADDRVAVPGRPRVSVQAFCAVRPAGAQRAQHDPRRGGNSGSRCSADPAHAVQGDCPRPPGQCSHVVGHDRRLPRRIN